MILFSVSNSALKDEPTNVLYMGQDNSLSFIFSVNTGSTTFYPGDLIQLRVQTGQLGSPGNVTMQTDANWEFAYNSIAGYDVFSFKAKQLVKITPLDTYTLQLNNLQPANLSLDFAFISQYQLGGRRESGTKAPMIISNPPGDLLDLVGVLAFTAFINGDQDGALQIKDNNIYISSQDLDPPIANSIHLNIAYSGEQPLATQWGKETPTITFFFTYGEEAYDLTDDINVNDKKPPQPYNALTSAWNIKAALSGKFKSYWNLEASTYNSEGDYPFWTLTPGSGNIDLFTKDAPSLELEFSHIISILPSGVALMYVQWNHIPGYYDSALVIPLQKQTTKPQILHFECSNADQQTPEALQLSWTIFAANKLMLQWDGNLRSKQIPITYDSDNLQLTYSGNDNSIMPDQLLSNLVYWVEDSQGQSGQQETLPITVQNLPAPQLSQFNAVYQQDQQGNWTIEFSWLAQDLGEGYYFQLNGTQLDPSLIKTGPYTNNGYPFSYTHQISEAIVASTFELVATDTGNHRSGNATVVPVVPAAFIPQITGFTATLERDGDNNPQVQFAATMNQVLDNARVYVTSRLGACALSLDTNSGAWRGTQQVGPAAPVQSDYILHAGNLANGPENSSRLQTGFSVAQEFSCWPEKFMPMDMVLSPDKQRVYVLSSDGNFTCHLSYFDPENIDNQIDIATFNVYQFGYYGTNPPVFSLSVAPDDSQVMLTAPELIVAVVLSGSDPAVMLVSKLAGGMEARFASLNNIIGYNGLKLYLFNPDPEYFPIYKNLMPYEFRQFNAGSDTPTYTALAMRSDGQRGFVAAQYGNDGRVYWFDTDPNNTGNPIAHCIDGCNQICGLAMAGNNWMYAIYQGSNNNVQLFAFDTTSGQSYDQSCAVAFGVFTSNDMIIAVSSDNSFVAVANYNNKLAWLLTGAWDMNTPPALRQDKMLNQQLLNGCSMVFARDNSRLFVAGFEAGGNACILVLEPVFS